MGKKPIKNETRIEILTIHNHMKLTNRDIAKRLNVSEKCVRTTIKNKTRFGIVGDSPRSGRPKKLSCRDESWLYRQVRFNPKMSIQDLTSDFNSRASGVGVSIETVRQALSKKGIGSYTATRKPLLSKKDMRKRKKWCAERLHWGTTEWSRVIFSDESNFEVINRKSKVIVKRLRNEKYLTRFCVPRVQGGGGSVGIWGCFSSKGIGCCEVYTGRVNQYIYRNKCSCSF